MTNTQNPAPTATHPVTDRRVHPARPDAGAVESRATIRTCEHCGVTLLPPKGRTKPDDRRRYCSQRCNGRAQAVANALDASTFLSQRAERDPDSGCLLWQGSTRPNGYGQAVFRQRMWKAHRLAYETWVGAIAGGMLVCHACDNRRCIEPTHLFLGSAADNNNDRDAKGRTAKGERNNSKLTEEAVRAIRASTAATKALAAEYGVFHTVIWKIRTRRAWAHVD